MAKKKKNFSEGINEGLTEIFEKYESNFAI